MIGGSLVTATFDGKGGTEAIPDSKDALSFQIDRPTRLPEPSSRMTNTSTNPGMDRSASAKAFMRFSNSPFIPGNGSAVAIFMKTDLSALKMH